MALLMLSSGSGAALMQVAKPNISPDKLAREVFLWTLSYVAAVAAAIWIFIVRA
jgi:hypothetical protein